MKIGIRKPSIKKRIKARTTGKLKRSIKKETTPFYSKKGAGLIKDPKKVAYNKIYKKTSVGCMIPLTICLIILFYVVYIML